MITFKGKRILRDILGKNRLKNKPNNAGMIMILATSHTILRIGKETSVWPPIKTATAQLESSGIVSKISRLLIAVSATAKAVSALMR